MSRAMRRAFISGTANCFTLSISRSMPEMKVFKAIALKGRPGWKLPGLPVRIEIIERMCSEWCFSSRGKPLPEIPVFLPERGAGLVEALDGRLGPGHQFHGLQGAIQRG